MRRNYLKGTTNMLRKISAYLSLISLVAVTLAPAMNVSATPRTGNHSRHVEKKAAPEFSNTNGSTATVRVLIQTKGAPTAAQDGALARAHGSKRASYDGFNMIVADVPLNQVAGLAARADVLYVAPDRPVKAQMNLTNDTTGVSQVQAGAPGFYGKSVTLTEFHM